MNTKPRTKGDTFIIESGNPPKIDVNLMSETVPPYGEHQPFQGASPGGGRFPGVKTG